MAHCEAAKRPWQSRDLRAELRADASGLPRRSLRSLLAMSRGATSRLPSPVYRFPFTIFGARPNPTDLGSNPISSNFPVSSSYSRTCPEPMS